MIGWRFNAVRQRKLRAELAHEFDFQERVQFHAILRHANLLMKNIKEAHAFHAYHPGWSETPEVRLRFCKLSGENLPDFSIVLRLR